MGSAKRINKSIVKEGKHLKCSKQHVSWRLVLPVLGNQQMLLEVHSSLRGHRQVLIDGDVRFDTVDPSKKTFRIKVATHCFDFFESDDGIMKLLVDDVPFDDLESFQPAAHAGSQAWLTPRKRARKEKRSKFEV